MAYDYAIVFKKNFQYANLFNNLILRLDQSGILHKLKRKWIYSTADTINLNCPSSTEPPSIGFGDFLSCLVILLIGLGVATLLTFSELYCQRKCLLNVTKNNL